MPSPFESTPTLPVALLRGEPIENTLISGQKWVSETPNDDGTTYVSYSFINMDSVFSQSEMDYSSSQEEDFFSGGFNSTEQNLVRELFNIIEDHANIKFEEVDETADNVGTIRFGWTSDPSFGSDPGRAYGPGEGAKAGDIWLHDDFRNLLNSMGDSNPSILGEFTTILLENILRSIGFKAPDEVTTIASQIFDITGNDLEVTVLAYDAYRDGLSESSTIRPRFPNDIQIYDIDALHHLYGANTVATAGDDIIHVSDDFLSTIYDTGGRDTIIVETSQDLFIDFSPGAFNEVYNPNTDSFEILFFITDHTHIEGFVGGSGNDVIIGTHPRDEFINGLGGADTIYGGDGNDFLVGGEGHDLIYAGLDNDTVFAGPGDNGDDRIFGGGGDDTLGGGAGDDFIAGDRQIFANIGPEGNQGSDLLFGGTGDDTLIGGDFRPGRSNDPFSSDTDSIDHPSNIIWGGPGDDFIFGSGTLGGGPGRDLIQAHSGSDLIFGGADQSADTILGGDGRDTIFAGPGDDIIHGEDSEDELFGGEGQDVIFGDYGNDTLFGGPGGDTLEGGEGEDVFFFSGDHGDDTIADFDFEEDTIRIVNSDLVSLEDILAALTFLDTGTLLDTGGGSIFFEGLTLEALGLEGLTLEDISLEDLPEINFIF